MRLAIVSPCYNEEDALIISSQRITTLLDDLVSKGKIAPNSFQLLVNDGSTDRTWEIIESLHRKNPYFKGLNLAHNVGHQNAIMAGMMTAKELADGVITIDADLQDDLNCIEEMIDAYKGGVMKLYMVLRCPGQPIPYSRNSLQKSSTDYKRRWESSASSITPISVS